MKKMNIYKSLSLSFGCDKIYPRDKDWGEYT